MAYSMILLTEEPLMQGINNHPTLSTDNILSIIAIVISIIAILISLLMMFQTKVLNNTNLQARYFEKIFTSYIVELIPDKAAKLCYTNDGFLDKNYKELVSTIMEMIQHSRYFAYAKHDFYSDMCKKSIELEDMLIECSSNQVTNKDIQNKNIYDIHIKIQDIVNLINKNYHKF